MDNYEDHPAKTSSKIEIQRRMQCTVPGAKALIIRRLLELKKPFVIVQADNEGEVSLALAPEDEVAETEQPDLSAIDEDLNNMEQHGSDGSDGSGADDGDMLSEPSHSYSQEDLSNVAQEIESQQQSKDMDTQGSSYQIHDDTACDDFFGPPQEKKKKVEKKKTSAPVEVFAIGTSRIVHGRSMRPKSNGPFIF